MTLEEAQNRLDFKKISYGTWRVTWNCYSRGYRRGITHDSLAVDRINSDVAPRVHLYGYTLLQAYESLYRCLTSEFYEKLTTWTT